MSKLYEIFKLKGEGYFLNIQLMYLDHLYISHQGIYGLKTFNNAEELEKNWDHVQLEFATKIQRRLNGIVSDLRWDMYLVFYIEDEISINTRKSIENDKTFFRKLIITPNEILENKLLLTLEIEEEKDFIFENSQFLLEFEKTLTPQAKEKLKQDFFSKGQDYSDQDIYKLFSNRKGKLNENY
ncbi:hypothetical protein COL36_10435 [Bacillus wiedmannii]|uniref:ABC-three component system middle component 1 n=1 Tax=Bacillus wiedmannii TaxID=1890302 RepID=UPI000BFA1754|nr:ABC-three component system middle component 1 [Bacillus wiedmannii]PFX61617.1 hypothetical protein COL36_10435 [Bacillus wiedmannii]